ncbi:MAG: PhoU domain-containing protein, partial [Bacteroidaceae bacterium]|nr:PhoU domain-containing protein [Bacteroidaceae bacterium]
SILEAQKEINVFAERCQRMFGFIRDLLNTEKNEDFVKLYSRIEKYEEITDRMELEIANYLNQVSEGRLSSDSKTKIQNMLRQVDELESIGDCCYNLGRTLSRKRQYSQEDFTDEQKAHIQNMISLVEESLNEMVVVVANSEQQKTIPSKAYNLEHEINNFRSQLKNQNIQDVNNHLYSYQIGVFYTDLISQCEKLGDYVLNVIQATCGRQ